jgi:hypothetical protein
MKILNILLISALITGCAEENKTQPTTPVQVSPTPAIYPELTGTCAVYSNIVKRWRNIANTAKFTFYANCTGKYEDSTGLLMFFDFRTNIVNESSAYPTMDDYMQIKVTSSNDEDIYPVGYYDMLHFWYIKGINQVIMQKNSTSFAIGYIQF